MPFDLIALRGALYSVTLGDEYEALSPHERENERCSAYREAIAAPLNAYRDVIMTLECLRSCCNVRVWIPAY